MGIKYFCDVCGEETKRNYVSDRLKPFDKHIHIIGVNGETVECEVIVAIDGSWNGGVICLECLCNALLQPEKEIEK